MTDLCLWLLLVGAIVLSLIRAADVEPGDRTHARVGATAFWSAAVVGVVVTGLWIWLAVLTDHWQFAAIAVQAPVIHFAASMGSKR